MACTVGENGDDGDVLAVGLARVQRLSVKEGHLYHLYHTIEEISILLNNLLKGFLTDVVKLHHSCCGGQCSPIIDGLELCLATTTGRRDKGNSRLCPGDPATKDKSVRRTQSLPLHRISTSSSEGTDDFLPTTTIQTDDSPHQHRLAALNPSHRNLQYAAAEFPHVWRTQWQRRRL